MRFNCGRIRIRIAPLLVVAGLALVVATFTAGAVAGNGNGNSGTTSINNGGGTPSCGNSCDTSHNPTDFHKPCTPVPGNGCHTLPDTPCERGHGNVEAKNKHCAVTAITFNVFLGYADSYLPRGSGLPSPWEG